MNLPELTFKSRILVQFLLPSMKAESCQLNANFLRTTFFAKTVQLIRHILQTPYSQLQTPDTQLEL